VDHWQAAGLIDTGKLQSFYECFGWIADNGPGSQSHRDRTQNVMDMQKVLEMNIEPEELRAVIKEMTTRYEEDGGADLFSIVVEKYCDAPEQGLCIVQRLQCLAPMMNDPRIKGWSYESAKDPECTITNGAVFHAAAKCPLTMSDARFAFDPDDFFRIVLEVTDHGGQA
jgi:hypothetical protein